MSIRVRFAPSPTGFLHVGGARTLLFNYLFARKNKGTLVLRIEDTDQARSTKQAEEMIYEDIRKLDMLPEEGPHHAGKFGPYRQSERLAVYAKYARKLLDANQAYYCFCPDEMLSQKRELALKMGKTPHYDGTCAKFSLAEAQQRLKSGEKAGIRFRASSKPYALNDLVKGPMQFGEGMVGDFFITRTPRDGSDGKPAEREIAEGIGMPVYNFCCVIDDATMEISHVIRGDDHLSNTARQLQLYEALGFKLPEFGHIAMVLGADKQKLSKRNGDSSVNEYLAKGFLPETLINFLALLGWWPPESLKPKSGHPEILSLQELIDHFDVHSLQKSAAVFDTKKLLWMNSQYIRALPIAELEERAKPFFDAGFDSQNLTARIEAIRNECSLLSEIPLKIAEVFGSEVEVADEAKTLLRDASQKPVLDALRIAVEELPEVFGALDVEGVQKKVAEKTQAKGKALFMPIRAAITGKTHGPELKVVLPILGKAKILARMQWIQKQLG